MQTTDPDNGLLQESTFPPDQAANIQAGPKPNNLGSFVPGDIVGGSYEVLGLVGKGGMGAVYRAKHVSMPAEYALKVLINDRLTDNSVIRFQNEAQAIAKLNHPNIIAIYNFGLHDGRLPFYVMDLLDGENLLEKIDRNGPAPYLLALPIFIEVCAGLSHAHRKGILHRDVKPANIVLLSTPDVRGALVKIVDFGVVKFDEELMPEVQKLTAMGAVVGSPSYMSPEQSSGERIDARSDIYSLGCSLFQALAGKVPFHGRNATETMLMHQEAPTPTLASKGGGRTYSEDLELFMAKMLAKAPMDRYQTMDSVAQDMRNVMEGKPLGTPQMILRRPGETVYSFDPPVAAAKAPQRNTRATTHDVHLLERAEHDRSVENKSADGATDRLTNVQRPTAKQSADNRTKGSSTGELTFGGTTFEGHSAQVKKTAKLVGITMLSVCLLGAISFFAWQSMQSAKQAQNAMRMDANPFSNNDQNSPNAIGRTAKLADPRGPADLDDATPVELTKARYFSKTVLLNGRPVIQFDFPKTSTGDGLAWIATTLGDSWRTIGQVQVVKGAPIYIVPGARALRVPQFFQKFRPGEITGIGLLPLTASDEMFEYATRVPGISQLLIPHCTRLTERIVPSLSKLHLTVFNATASNIDGAQLAKANIWQNLKTIRLAKCKNLTPILQKLSGSKKLIQLDVSDTKLSATDYQMIAKLPNLTALNLTSNRLAIQDIRVLARLQRLNSICALYTRLSGGSLAEEFKHFPALKEIVILRGSMKMAELQQLKQSCPKLSVKELSSDQIRTMSQNMLQDQW
jgi:serine/threonine protein kinase